MAWSVYDTAKRQIIRYNKTHKGHIIRFIKKVDGEFVEQMEWNVEENEIEEKVLSMLGTYNINHVLYTENVPYEVLIAIENREYIKSLEPVQVDEDENLFANVDSMTTDEKIFLNDEYKEKIELPNMLSSTNRVAGLFVSAGFATAITYYSMFWALVLGTLSGIVALSGYVAIKQIRTTVTKDNAPELYETFHNAVRESQHVDDANMYVIKNVIKSPFTLPMKSDVYFPLETIENMTEGEIQAIVEHELGHHDKSHFSMFTIAASIASTLLIAPLIVYLTSIEAGVTLFLVLVAYTGTVQILNLVISRLDEEVADKNVSKKNELVKSLIRLSPSVYHVNNKPQSLVHRLFDVHPPMNKRIENLYDGNVSIRMKRNDTWGTISWIGAIMVIVGSLLIGYGFLTFTSAGVSDVYIFYGTILTAFGIMPQYYVNKGWKKTRNLGILLCISFTFTVGLGFWMGAESIVGAVAHGRIGRQILGLAGTMVLMIAILLSTVKFDFSPKENDIPEPATDWFSSIDNEN